MDKFRNLQKIPFLNNPDSLHFRLPEGLHAHHVMIKNAPYKQEDIEYYRKFCVKTYDKYIMSFELGENQDNPHFHILGWNTDPKNKFSNFKYKDAKLRKATMNEETKHPHLAAALEDWGITPVHLQVYYILKEYDPEELIFSNLDELPVCCNGYKLVMTSLPAKIQLKMQNAKVKNRSQNKNFLSLLIENYPEQEINQKYWNDERRNDALVKKAIFDYTLDFCKHWNLTKPNAKSLAKKIFKDFCYTLWMQYYMHSSKTDYDDLLHDTFPECAF